MPKTAKYSLAVRGEQSIAYGEELRRSSRKYKKCKNIGFLKEYRVKNLGRAFLSQNLLV